MLEALHIPYVSTSLPPLLEQPQWKRAKIFLRPYEPAEELLSSLRASDPSTGSMRRLNYRQFLVVHQ
jgi:hypothetical protein